MAEFREEEGVFEADFESLGTRTEERMSFHCRNVFNNCKADPILLGQIML